MSSPREPTSASLRIVLTYAILAGLWVVVSDLLVAVISTGPNLGTLISTAKGLAFVAVTAVLLFWLISRKIAALTAAHRQEVDSEQLQISEVAEQARRLRHANRLYAVLSAVNRTITRKPERQELLREICRILVETGDFRMVWFGAPNADGWIIPEISWGAAQEYLTGIRISRNDIPEGRGPTGTAIRENRPLICNDIPANPAMHPWREAALKHGIFASACFPVTLPGGGIAGLTVYSAERDFFSASEESLLAEICTDIGYALEFIAAEEQRSAAEEMLRERVRLQEQLATIASTVPGVIYSFRMRPDGSFCFPYSSSGFEDLYGIPADLVTDTAAPLFERVHPDDQQPNLESIRASARALSSWRREFRYQHPHKGEIWLECLSIPQREADGGYLWHGYAHDISERKQADGKLRDSERKFSTFSDVAQDAIILMDDQGKVSFWNPAAERIFGYCADEIMGEPMHQLLAPLQYRDAYTAAHAHFAQTGQGNAINRTLELSALRKSGEEFPIELSLSSFQSGGRWYAAGILRDITYRKRGEAELLQAKEVAEAANQAKSRFLANMSHELRTPMNGVLGMIQLTQFGTLDEAQRGYLDMAITSGFGLVRILDDILDLAKVEAKSMTLENKPFSVRECVSDAATLLLPETVRKGIQLEVSLAKDVPETMRGDQIRLRQILTNLIGNAVKFTAQGTVVVRVTATAGGITFTVTDTGIGIPEDKRRLLFQPFSQVDDSDTRRFGGAGLGLVISREIVALMGGTIICESTEGLGSSFSFTIPCLPQEMGTVPNSVVPSGPPSAPEPVLAPVTCQGRTPRILVAEDDPTNRALMQLALRRQNIESDSAGNGHDAVERWASGAYDLIIMDLQMPVMDGIAATRAIREQEQVRGGHIPILAMTAHAYRTDEEWCLNSGMDGYLAKPVDLNDVMVMVRRFLDNGIVLPVDRTNSLSAHG